MKPDLSIPQIMTRAEQEARNEANRLIDQVESALAVVAVRSKDEAESLEVLADRIERAARDLSDALRELAHSRAVAAEET